MNQNVKEESSEDKFDFNKMTNDQKATLANKYDNFLEALFLSPQMFSKDVIKFMKYREKSLRELRIFGQGLGFITAFSIYLVFRLKSWKGFYFRNICKGAIGGVILGFSLGRLFEYYGNKVYFRTRLYELALHFNISDEEISELQLKIAENMLEKNMQEVKTKGTLDKIKFKI
jgi:hypothetical protein